MVIVLAIVAPIVMAVFFALLAKVMT